MIRNRSHQGVDLDSHQRLIVGNSVSDLVVSRTLRTHDDIYEPVRIIIRHQPNFLAYWKLFGQIALANSVANELHLNGLATEVIFVATDYDAWRDDRFRRTELPLLNAARPYTYMRVCGQPGLGRHRIIAQLGDIPAHFPHYLQRQMIGATTAIAGAVGSRHNRAFREAVLEVLNDVLALLKDVRGWPEFCCQYILKASTWFRFGTVRLESGYERLVAEQQAVRLLLRRSALWRSAWSLCSRCGSRFEYVDSRPTAPCPYCYSLWTYDNGIIIPKVVVDNVLDEQFYPNSIMLSHMGSLEHLLESLRLSELLGEAGTCLHVVSDQGARHDYLTQTLTAHSSSKTLSAVFPISSVAAVARRAALGSYSSIYYLVADRFERAVR